MHSHNTLVEDRRRGINLEGFLLGISMCFNSI